MAAAAAAGMSESAYSSVVNSMTDAIANNASSQYAALYSLQQGVNPNLPGMMPMIKRPAVPDKSGMPMYQPQSAPQAAAAAYSPFVPLPGQQQFVPVTQTLQYYRGEQSSPYSPGVAGHPAGLGPRY